MCAEQTTLEPTTGHYRTTKAQDKHGAITCRSVAQLTRLKLSHPTSPNHPVTPAKPTHIPANAAMNCLNQWTHTGNSSNVSCRRNKQAQDNENAGRGDGSSKNSSSTSSRSRSTSAVNRLEPHEQAVNRNHLGGNKHKAALGQQEWHHLNKMAPSDPLRQERTWKAGQFAQWRDIYVR